MLLAILNDVLTLPVQKSPPKCTVLLPNKPKNIKYEAPYQTDGTATVAKLWLP